MYRNDGWITLNADVYEEISYKEEIEDTLNSILTAGWLREIGDSDFSYHDSSVFFNAFRDTDSATIELVNAQSNKVIHSFVAYAIDEYTDEMDVYIDDNEEGTYGFSSVSIAADDFVNGILKEVGLDDEESIYAWMENGHASPKSSNLPLDIPEDWVDEDGDSDSGLLNKSGNYILESIVEIWDSIVKDEKGNYIWMTRDDVFAGFCNNYPNIKKWLFDKVIERTLSYREQFWKNKGHSFQWKIKDWILDIYFDDVKINVTDELNARIRSLIEYLSRQSKLLSLEEVIIDFAESLIPNNKILMYHINRILSNLGVLEVLHAWDINPTSEEEDVFFIKFPYVPKSEMTKENSDWIIEELQKRGYKKLRSSINKKSMSFKFKLV